MPRIKDIRPKVRKVQCSHPFTPSGYTPQYMKRRIERYRRLNKDPDCCGNFAVYVVDGKPLCEKHASSAALEILLENEDEDRTN